jgi:hypothetical protein
VSYAHFLFDAIFISEIAGGSRFMKKTINLRKAQKHKLPCLQGSMQA